MFTGVAESMSSLVRTPVLDDLFQQPVVAASPNDVACVIGPVAALVAEVVRFVDHHEIERAPVESGQIDSAGAALVAAQIRVGHHRIAEAILLERVVALRRPRRVAGPVRLQPLGAKHEDALVAQLEELDDGERSPGLPETHALGDDAAVVPQQPIDGAGHAVSLELVEGLPDFGVVEVDVVEQPFSFPLPGEPVLEDMEEGLVVDELRGVRPGEARKRGEHLLLGVASQALVVPQFVEPSKERLPVRFGANLQVDLDVGRRAEAEPAKGEVGASDERGAGVIPPRQVVELAVKEIGLPHGPDVYLVLDPVGAGTGESLLHQCVAELDAAVFGQAEGLRLATFGVHRTDTSRLAVQKTHPSRAVQHLAQRLVGVNREVGGDNRKVGARPEPFAEKVANAALPVVDDGVHCEEVFSVRP